MRLASKSGEYVADVDRTLHGAFEPVCLGVQGLSQFEGPGVRDLNALLAHQSQIDEHAAVLLPENSEYFPQKRLVAQLLEIEDPCDKLDYRKSFVEEAVDALLVFLDQFLEMSQDFALIRSVEV